MESIEAMLYKQLLAAVGKEVTPVDFANYMVRALLRVCVCVCVLTHRSCITTGSCSRTRTSPRRSATLCGAPITVSAAARPAASRARMLTVARRRSGRHPLH